LSGIGLKVPDISARMASHGDFSIYAMCHEDIRGFKEAGINVQASICEALAQADVVIDATPSGVGKRNKEELYSKYGVKSIFQAGEALDVADLPAFMSVINYNDAKRLNSVRIPSPSTVSLVRALKPLDEEFGVRTITYTIVRPGSEPMRGHCGPVDTIVPDELPLGSAAIDEEMKRIFPRDLLSASLAIPSILLAVGVVTVDLERAVSTREVIEVLSKASRIILARGHAGLHSTDAIFEYIRRIARQSGDVYELCVWLEYVEVTGHRLKLVQAFDVHCVQTPEVIDAIRALAGTGEMHESVNRTNKALRILSPGIYP
jgi:glyceraldehyde-3-phosphate dehydrogenase (NAD(P))